MTLRPLRFRDCCIIGFILAVFLTFAGQGSFSHSMALGVSLWVAIFFFLMSIFSFLIGYFCKSPDMRVRSKEALNLTILFLIPLLSSFPGKFLSKDDMRIAMTYCESLVPSLEKFHKETGQYPEDISVLLGHSKLPRVLLKFGRFYYSDGKTYSFRLRDPSQIMMGWDFYSGSKKWKRYD